MRLFSCQSCSQILFFENTRCERCFRTLGFWPDTTTLSALEPAPDSIGDTWTALGIDDARYRLCTNAAFGVCNWLVDAGSGKSMCAACRHNRLVPELDNADRRIAWRKIEAAKHRLFYTLFKLGLVQSIDTETAAEPLIFDFLADYPEHPRPEGHDRTRQRRDHDRAERGGRRGT